MSTGPESSPYPAPPGAPYQAPLPQQSNAMGLTGFILSLCGFICGISFPIGLIVSLIGLRREPKGFAIAGTVIGAIGTLLVVFILVFYSALIAACIGVGVAMQPLAETETAIGEARTRINDYEVENGRLPDEAEGNDLIGDLKDGWEKELRYELLDGEYEIRSAGPDGVFDTDDDKTVDDFLFFDAGDFDSDAGDSDSDAGGVDGFDEFD